MEEIKPLLYLQKKNGTSKQIIALEKLLDEIASGSSELTHGASEKEPVSPSQSVHSGARVFEIIGRVAHSGWTWYPRKGLIKLLFFLTISPGATTHSKRRTAP